jgi:predicted exporter
MMRVMAAIWLGVVVLLGVNLAWRVHQGLVFRTDLMALLPRDEANPALQLVTDSVAQALSRRVAILVGDRDRARARQAAKVMAQRLAASALVEADAGSTAVNRFAEVGALYFPYRAGLLSEADRQSLLDGHADALATRALSQVFGIAGLADARLLRRDPFMLLPGFLAALPAPSSRLGIDDGMLSVADAGVTWILVSGHLLGDPYALDIQARMSAAFDAATRAVREVAPEVQILHAGAVFFADAGARTTLADMSGVGIASGVGTVALVLLVFRAVTPLLLSLLAIGVGMGAGLSVSLLLFGDLHILTLLLGLSLIGIAVDYSLYYCVEVFSPGQRSPRQRLARVMPGITLGMVTTVVGYATFLLAPFPGLRQVAAFSVVGLIASFLTVVLWLPLLDRRGPANHGPWLLAAMTLLWRFWEAPGLRVARIAVLAALACVGGVGAFRISTLDDVRRMQSLSPGLVAEQARMQQIAGFNFGTQFFVVRAADEETALRREETLLDRLRPLRLAGALGGYRAPASFVPSAERQRQDRALVRDRLEMPLLAGYLAQIGLSAAAPDATQAAAPDGVLTLAMAAKTAPLATVLDDLIVADAGGVAHVVMLDGVARGAAVRDAARGIDGVSYVDPAADFSRLLGRYRRRAVALIAVSAVLMLPLLALRYGMRGAVRVMLPAVATIVLVPLAKAVCGERFTFFDAMALVLVLSIAVDYAVFCAEADATYKPVALLGVWMAMVSTVLSFGLLDRSQAAAVHALGSSMLLGVVLAFLLAPMAGTRRGRHSG